MKQLSVLSALLLGPFILLGTQTDTNIAPLNGAHLTIHQRCLSPKMALYIEYNEELEEYPENDNYFWAGYEIKGVSRADDQTIHPWQKDEKGQVKKSATTERCLKADLYYFSKVVIMGQSEKMCIVECIQLRKAWKQFALLLDGYLSISNKSRAQTLREEIQKIQNPKDERIRLWLKEQAEQNYPAEIIEAVAITDSETIASIDRK